MKTPLKNSLLLNAIILAATTLTTAVLAQPANRPTPPPPVTSPEVTADRNITFRILAPKAEKVMLTGSDIPGIGQGAEMTKGTNGIWEVALKAVEPGAYRYNFNVDGVSVIDPRNSAVSESNNNVWSLVYVPGADFMDTKNVPRGAVCEITYYSKSLERHRRMHVYTPPGYESGQGKYPVFYLLHGASDSDDSWSSVGRAGFILDNLIAAKKATPMVVVMPAGHTRSFSFGAREGGTGSRPPVDEFVQDFVNDIMPCVENRFRVYADRQHRAMAGLSMGGGQTLNIAIPKLDQFAYIGVFSSGIFDGFGRRGASTNAPSGPTWEERHKATLENEDLKKGLKLVWFNTGADDFLLETTRRSVALLKKYGFEVTSLESSGGHTWTNWRNYLNEFAPLLFQKGEE